MGSFYRKKFTPTRKQNLPLFYMYVQIPWEDCREVQDPEISALG